jgi:hypothetical protein
MQSGLESGGSKTVCQACSLNFFVFLTHCFVFHGYHQASDLSIIVGSSVSPIRGRTQLIFHIHVGATQRVVHARTGFGLGLGLEEQVIPYLMYLPMAEVGGDSRPSGQPEPY